jgi:hypothetical protein
MQNSDGAKAPPLSANTEKKISKDSRGDFQKSDTDFFPDSAYRRLFTI